MIVDSVGDNFIVFTPEPGREIVRLCDIFGLDASGICKVLVTIVRDPLDRGNLHAKINDPRADARTNADDPQSEFFQPL